MLPGVPLDQQGQYAIGGPAQYEGSGAERSRGGGGGGGGGGAIRSEMFPKNFNFDKLESTQPPSVFP